MGQKKYLKWLTAEDFPKLIRHQTKTTDPRSSQNEEDKC